jgi:hypothetical protein
MCEFILKTIIEAIIIGGVSVGFIKLVFEKKLENYKKKEIIKQRAILIADLISEWISCPEDRKKLNQLTLEAFIWLPEDIATKLSLLLSHDRNAPQTREIVAEVRKIILDEKKSIDSNIIIIFPAKATHDT